MTDRRRYSRADRVAAVAAVGRGESVLGAATSRDVPESTLRSWLMKPEFANLRDRTKADATEEALALAALAADELAQQIRAHQVEPRDLAVIYGVATDKGQLLRGEATHRTETKALTSELDEDAKSRLRHILYEASLEDDAEGSANADSVGDRAGVVGQ